MTDKRDAIAPHPHAWIHDGVNVAVCFLCGALPDTPLGNALCVKPWPEKPPPGLRERVGLSGFIIEVDRDTPEYVLTLWKLVLADEHSEIAQLEAQAGATQIQAVDHFIEDTYWSEDLPAFVGGKGTPTERRAALLAAYQAHQAKG